MTTSSLLKIIGFCCMLLWQWRERGWSILCQGSVNTHLSVVLQVYTYSKWKQQAYLTDTCCDFWIKLLIVNVLRTMGQCFQFSLVLHKDIWSHDQKGHWARGNIKVVEEDTQKMHTVSLPIQILGYSFLQNIGKCNLIWFALSILKNSVAKKQQRSQINSQALNRLWAYFVQVTEAWNQ